MRKNVSGQVVGAQMVSADDGSAFTGTVTCAVTLDGGSQSTGSVGSGVCTHEGNGYHTYTPSQGETNGNLAAYTFTGSGAVPVTVQVYTTSLNPHDTVRAGMTALPNAAAEASGGLPTLSAAQASNGTINANVHRWLTGTPSALSSGRVDATVGAMQSNVLTASAINADAITAAKIASDVGAEIADAVWNEDITTHTTEDSAGEAINDIKQIADEAPAVEDIAGAVWDEDLTGHTTEDSAGEILGNVATGTPPSAEAVAEAVWAESTRTLTALDEDGTTLDIDAAVRAAVGLNSANLDTQLDALPTAAENATAVWGAGTRTLSALDEDTTTLDLDATIRAAVGMSSANLDTQLEALPTTTAEATAAEVLSAAASSPIPANVKAINDATVTGDGTTGSPWDAE